MTIEDKEPAPVQPNQDPSGIRRIIGWHIKDSEVLATPLGQPMIRLRLSHIAFDYEIEERFLLVTNISTNRGVVTVAPGITIVAAEIR